MATLILKKDDKVEKTIVLSPGQSMHIGRKESNDIVVDDLTVSGSHAKLDYMDEGFLITDMRSKNGTFVNGERINSEWLKPGDVIGIGTHTLEVSLEGEEGFTINEGEMDKTMVMKAGQQPPPPKDKMPEAALTFLEGGSGEVPLTKKLTKMVVTGMMVGKTAATISKRPDGYFLSYIGGWTKPKLNGETVSESAELKDFDIIEIGSAKLEFYTKGK
jgi:hypothetical protein